MAIRQEQYTIYIKPYIETTVDSINTKIFLSSNSSLYIANSTSESSSCKHSLSLKKKDTDGEFWVSCYSSNSLDKTRVKYKELLNEVGQENLYVGKSVPEDIIVTPYN